MNSEALKVAWFSMGVAPVGSYGKPGRPGDTAPERLESIMAISLARLSTSSGDGAPMPLPCSEIFPGEGCE